MNDTNRRNHFRVEILVPVKWHILNEEEMENVKKGHGRDLFKQNSLPTPIDEFLEQSAPGSKDEQLFQCLQLINNKLDFIINHMLPQTDDSLYNHDNIVEISASGLKFSTQDKIDKGSFLKMDLIMPGTHQYQVEIIAEALRVTDIKNKYIIAARILCINEDTRDSIIKMVFQKQRMDIRRLKTGEEDINVD